MKSEGEANREFDVDMEREGQETQSDRSSVCTCVPAH